MLKHWQTVLAAAAAAAVLAATMVASLTIPAQAYPPASGEVFEQGPAGRSSERGLQAPAVTTVWPVSGYNFQATMITITGTGYVATPSVALGSVPIANVTFINATTITATVPADLPTGDYTLTVTNPDTTSSALANAFTVLTSGDAVLGTWAGMASISSVRDWPAVAGSGDNVYLLGGGNPNFWTNSAMQSSVERTRIRSDGALEPWQTTSSMGTARTVFAAVAHGSHLYALGGWGSGGSGLSSVEVTAVNADGSLGPWQAATSMSTTRVGPAAVVAGNNIYALGSGSGSNTTTSVERAAISPDGTLGPWQQTSAMSVPRGYLASVVVGNYIYAIGGQNTSASLNTVERATINSDGSLGAWTPVSSMVKSRCDLAAVALRGYIYAIGGSTCTGITYPSVERAKVNPDGSLDAWEIVSNMSASRYRLSAVSAHSFLYAIGGTDEANAVLGTIERAEVSPLSLTGLSPSLVRASQATTVTVSGGNFNPAAVLGLGSGASIATNLVSTTTLTATVPSGLAGGWYTATLTNGDGRTATLTNAMMVDDTPPTGSISAQGWTSPWNPVTVTLSLSSTDSTSSVSHMAFSTDGQSYSDWESFATARSYLAPTSATIVYARYKDQAGNVSNAVSATVTLDSIAPSGSIAAQGWTSPWNPITVTLALSATDSTSGVSQMAFSTDGVSYSDWESFATSRSYLAPTSATIVYARYKDQAGNVSNAVSATVTLDSIAPTGTLSVNGGAIDTTSLTVTVALLATDSLSGVADSSYSNDGSAWSAWEAFATSKQWMVTEGDGDKSVWTRLRDAAGNVSTPVSRTINLDTTINGITGVSINDGDLFTHQVTVTLSLPGVAQASQMIISNDGAFAGSTWEPYTAYKAWAITRYGNYVIPRTVYVKYKDSTDNISATYQDDIVLDVNAPTGSVSIETGGGSTPSDVALSLSATDLETGVGGMMISSSPTFSGSTWLQFQPNVAWNMGSGSKVYTVFKDNAGNATPIYGASLSGSKESLPSLVLGTVHPKTGGDLVSEETKIAVSFPPGAIGSKADLTLVPAVEPDLETSMGSLVESKPETSTGFSQPSDRSIVYDYDTGRRGSVGKFMTLTAKAGNSPLTSFSKSFNLSVAFDYDTGWAGRVKESSLAIYSWNGKKWVKEAGSRWNGSSRTVSASVNHLSSFAVLGELNDTQTTYLPLLTKQSGAW